MQDDQAQLQPFPGSPVVPQTFDDSKVIQFQCRPGIACWNACCSNIDISLTPYDILRLKRRFGTRSGEFLRQYTVPYEIEQDSIAGVKLRPVVNGTACQFMTPAGCSVYEDRPTACRYYPVALLSLRRQDEYTDLSSYALVEEPHCLGHQEPRPISVADYRKEQGLRSLELFFMVCYDLDRFSQFVASEGFSDIYELPAEELKDILCDDVELMQFGFRFLRQVLFGEETIPLRREAAEQRRLRHMERQQRLATEAAARRAMEQDEMYENTNE